MLGGGEVFVKSSASGLLLALDRALHPFLQESPHSSVLAQADGRPVGLAGILRSSELTQQVRTQGMPGLVVAGERGIDGLKQHEGSFGPMHPGSGGGMRHTLGIIFHDAT